MKITRKRFLLSIAIVMGMSTVSYSQQTKTQTSDTAFILKNVKDNRMEMQLSQAGIDKGDAQVRKIARQMLFDHDKMLNDLADVAKKKNMKGVIDGSETASTYPATGADNAATSTTTTSTDTTGNTVTSGTSTGSGTTGTTGTAGASSTNESTGTSSGTGASAKDGNSAGATQGTMAMPAIPSLTDIANATGAEFSKMWIQHMTSMHQAKLAELQAASKTLTDPDLLGAINKAIPKVQMHLDMLSKANTGATGNNSMQH